ncbi:hypothetical protein HCB83_04175 [Listeria booriae]|nr:hypothetical protein [Listeria booriae]
MLNKKMKKTASVLSISALLGTTIVTPLGVLSTNATLAQAATAATPSADATSVSSDDIFVSDFSVHPFSTSMGDTYRFNNYTFGTTPTFIVPSQQAKWIDSTTVLTKVPGETDTFVFGTNKLKKLTLLGANKTGIRIDNTDGDSADQTSIGVATTLVPGKEYTVSYTTVFNKPGKQQFGYPYVIADGAWGNGSSAHIAPTSINSGPITGTFIAPPGAASSALLSLSIYTPKGAIIDILDLKLTTSDAQKKKDLEAAAQTAVNDLFTGSNPANDIKAGLTQAEIDSAKDLVSQLDDSTLKNTLTDAINKAQTQLDQQNDATAYNNARAAVNDLFANKDTSGAVKAGLTQADIDAAQVLANKVVDPTKKAELQKDLNQAQQQLDAINAAAASVKALFNNNDTTGTIKATTDQAAIDAAQKAIDAVTEPAAKAELQANLNKAQEQLDAQKAAELAAQNQAREAVNNLFTNQDPTGNITGTMTQSDIDAAQALINKVTDPAKKADLQKDLDAAQAQLNAKNEATADASVKDLFNNNDTTGTIKDATDQKAIDAAQKAIDAVANPAKKADLQKDLNEAQAQLDARNAAEAADKGQQVIAGFLVNQLYQNNDPSTDAIKDITNQAAIDAAQTQVDLLLPSAVKTDLQNKVNRAQELLDARNEAAAEQARQAAAEASIKDLFNNNDTTGTIKDATDQKAIDAAQKTIDAVTDPTKKAELQKDLDEAQKQLDARNAAAEAEKANQAAAEASVKDLFNNNDTTGTIKDATDQKAIDAAQKTIDAVTDSTKKAELQKDLDEAQNQLDAKNAAAEADKLQQAVATFAVNQLFQNNDPSTDAIKDTTVQHTIDTAQAQVDLLLPSAVKTDLQNKLNRAQELLDARNQAATEQEKQAAAEASVKDLFQNNDVNGAIKATTDQKAIDAAQKTIDAVTDPTKKAELQSDLDKAQAQLDAKNAAELAAQNQAREAVNNLFTNQDPTGTITGTLTQGNIDAAQALINKVTDSATKAALQSDLDKAQQQLNDRNNAVIAVPQLNPMTEADTVFSGKLDVTYYNPGTIRIYINNVATTVVPVDANGNFTYNIGNRKAGDVISVDYKDRTGQYNAATKASITVTPVTSTTVINKMTENDDTISGQTIPNAKVRYLVDGQAVNVGYADANGIYSKYVGTQKPGTVVGVEVFDVASNQYKPAVTTIVKAVNVTIVPMTTADDTVTGKAPANAKLRISINGVAVNIVTADGDGNYSKLIGKQSVGTVVSIEMFNTDTGKYEFAKDTTVTGAPVSIEYTVSAMTTNDDTLTGTAPANAKLRYSINGQLISVITADGSGIYSKFIGKQKEGTVVSVALLNGNTNQYTTNKDITVSAATGASQLAPMINTIIAGTGVVSGTVPQDVTTVRTWVNGVAQVMVPVTNGTFTWTKANLNEGDIVKVDYKDATGNWISAEKVVTK